jgi:hypothetical protein
MQYGPPKRVAVPQGGQQGQPQNRSPRTQHSTAARKMELAAWAVDEETRRFQLVSMVGGQIRTEELAQPCGFDEGSDSPSYPMIPPSRRRVDPTTRPGAMTRETGTARVPRRTGTGHWSLIVRALVDRDANGRNKCRRSSRRSTVWKHARRGKPRLRRTSSASATSTASTGSASRSGTSSSSTGRGAKTPPPAVVVPLLQDGGARGSGAEVVVEVDEPPRAGDERVPDRRADLGREGSRRQPHPPASRVNAQIKRLARVLNARS